MFTILLKQCKLEINNFFGVNNFFGLSTSFIISSAQIRKFISIIFNREKTAIFLQVTKNTRDLDCG